MGSNLLPDRIDVDAAYVTMQFAYFAALRLFNDDKLVELSTTHTSRSTLCLDAAERWNRRSLSLLIFACQLKIYLFPSLLRSLSLSPAL